MALARHPLRRRRHRLRQNPGLVHGSQNAITQGFFAEYTTQDDNSVYYVSEVGALIAVAWLVAAYLFWRKQHDLSTPTTTDLQHQ